MNSAMVCLYPLASSSRQRPVAYIPSTPARERCFLGLQGHTAHLEPAALLPARVDAIVGIADVVIRVRTAAFAIAKAVGIKSAATCAARNEWFHARKDVALIRCQVTVRRLNIESISGTAKRPWIAVRVEIWYRVEGGIRTDLLLQLPVNILRQHGHRHLCLPVERMYLLQRQRLHILGHEAVKLLAITAPELREIGAFLRELRCDLVQLVLPWSSLGLSVVGNWLCRAAQQRILGVAMVLLMPVALVMLVMPVTLDGLDAVCDLDELHILLHNALLLEEQIVL